VTQLAFALFDLMYRALTEGLGATAVPLRRDFEQQIHTNEITQEALTSRRTAARTRSPRGPAAVQCGFQVIPRHTVNVSSVEIMILLSWPSGDGSIGNGVPGLLSWSRVRTGSSNSADSPQFLSRNERVSRGAKTRTSTTDLLACQQRQHRSSRTSPTRAA
jgi:hypothetical protein